MRMKALLLAAAVLALGGPATAATFSPAGGSFTLTGSISAANVATVTCAATLYGVVSADGATATITGGAYAPGDPQCGSTYLPNDFPWTLQPGFGSSVNLLGLGQGYFVGYCSGSIIGAPWVNGPPGSFTLPNAMIPGWYGACQMRGTLSSSTLSLVP